MSTLAVIPARGGSRRIKRKNLRPFFGKPLLAHSVELAQRSGLFDDIIVSSDDYEILEIAQRYGAVGMLRNADMSRDEIGTQEVVAHVLSDCNLQDGDYACCIYPTAPLMSIEDLHEGYNAVRMPDTHWALSAGYPPLRDAAQFYWGSAWSWGFQPSLIGPNTRLIHVVAERVCDINTPADFNQALRMYGALHGLTINGQEFIYQAFLVPITKDGVRVW